MLQGMTCASPPDFLMLSATSLQASALREEITTLAPSLASSSAEARPMPRLEPVMTATWPVRSNGGFFIVVASLVCPFDFVIPGCVQSTQARNDGLHQPAGVADAAHVVVGVAESVLDHGQ